MRRKKKARVEKNEKNSCSRFFFAPKDREVKKLLGEIACHFFKIDYCMIMDAKLEKRKIVSKIISKIISKTVFRLICFLLF